VFLSAETTYGSIAEDLGLPDQWDWEEEGRVDLGQEEVEEILLGLDGAARRAGASRDPDGAPAGD